MPVSLKLLRRFEKVKTVIADRDKARSALAAAQSAFEAAQGEVDRLRGEVAELRGTMQGMQDTAQELQSRPAYGTEEFDLRAAERQRDRMRRIQPYLPRSTAGVFSYSQHQQELFALEHHQFKRDGFFLEIGVGNGKEYSNTYLLETYFGWNGILCEPNPVYADAIRTNRRVPLETRAAFSATGETVRFLCVPGIYGALSTISEFSASDQHNRYGEEVEVKTISLEDLLTEHGAPGKIDYMSLDTEGSETAIIQDFDFGKWDIAVLTIEHNLVPGRVETFDEILKPYGYRRVLSDVSAVDGWYIKA